MEIKKMPFVKPKRHTMHDNNSFENVSLPLKKPAFELCSLESFQKCPPVVRRKIFFKSLNRGDVLHLKLLKEQPDCFRLLALYKYKGCMKIDDLSIVMELPKLPQELKYLSPYPFHFIKAALSACNMKERILYVTLDTSILRDEFKNIQLGPFPYEAHNQRRTFFGNSFSENMYEVGEISKHKQLQGRQLQKSMSYYDQAVSSYASGALQSTLFLSKQAISSWKENYKALLLASKCYTLGRDGPSAFLYAEKAFAIYRKSNAEQEQMFALLIDVAKLNLFQRNKNYAIESLKMALFVDPINENVFNAINSLT